MTLSLYGHRLSQPCRAVEILLRELGTAYHWQAVDFANGETRERWFADTINPFQKIPALVVSTDDEDNASADFVLGESHAIMRYLCRTAPIPEAARRWYPGDHDPARSARIDQWLAWHHDNVRRHDMFHHIMNLHLTLPMLKTEIQQTLLQPLQHGLNPALATLEAHFERQPEAHDPSPTLCGDADPTLADLSIACELHQIAAVGYRLDRYPRVASWLDAITQRPHVRDIASELTAQGRTICNASGAYLDLNQAFA